MKLEGKSARRLAMPAAAAVAMLVAGVVGVAMSNVYLQKARVERQAAADERRAAQDKLSRATQEEREIREKLVDYRRLLDRGIIGDEQRLDWVDTIGQIKAARRIYDIKYAISPQKTFDVPGAAASGGDVEFRVSELKLDMMLLHEEDMLAFLDDLQRQLKTHVMVRSCSMQRLDRGGLDRPGSGPRLRAECYVDLVTIRDRKLKLS
jgi:hypothetical protein